MSKLKSTAGTSALIHRAVLSIHLQRALLVASVHCADSADDGRDFGLFVYILQQPNWPGMRLLLLSCVCDAKHLQQEAAVQGIQDGRAQPQQAGQDEHDVLLGLHCVCADDPLVVLL